MMSCIKSGRFALVVTVTLVAASLGLMAVFNSGRLSGADAARATTVTRPASPKAAPQAPGPDCPECRAPADDGGVTIIPRTGDPEIDAVIHEEVMARVREKLQAKREVYLQQRLEELNTWRGTNAMISRNANVEDAERPVYTAAVAAFNDRSPLPEERRRMFAEYFEDDAGIRCVGWDLSITAAVPNDAGYELTAYVRPKLQRQLQAVFTRQVSVETWQFTDDLELHFIDAKDNGERGRRFFGIWNPAPIRSSE